MQSSPHCEFNKYLRVGEVLTHCESRDNYHTNYDHGSKEIPKEFISYYPECFVSLDQEDIDKLKAHPSSKLVKHHYSGEYQGLFIGDAFIHD